MMEDSSYYNDLSASLDQARALLIRGAKDRKSAAHHPVISSIGPDAFPEQRIMILRAVNWEERSLRFHTDARSDKIAQLSSGKPASVLIYDPGKKLQIRLKGTAQITVDSAAVDQAWSSSTTFARRCYMAEQTPGAISETPSSGLPTWIEGQQPDESQLAPARENFAILLIEFNQIEWLYLANAGHRRARWTWNGYDWQGHWLIP